MLMFVSATFEVGEPSHYLTETTYSPGIPIKGWINISLNQESTGSLFRDSGGNSITLSDLIKKNPDFDYSCSTVNCDPDYSAIEGENSKEFNLGAGKTTGIGLKFNENLVNINSISFDVHSNASSSCTNQLKIDFFAEGKVEFMNSKISNESCAIKIMGVMNQVFLLENFQLESFQINIVKE